ncbi:MAG: DUF3473 domain-containing protein [Nitrospirae bacterium]|nr:DUF3473 domain-containing protein [Nitrospirota bacterium]
MENCLAFDIEGFVESNLQSFPIDRKYISRKDEDYEIEHNVDTVLKLLDEADVKATFFFLGRIGADIPHIVRKTAGCGHEIACHSQDHTRIFDMTQERFRDDLIKAKKTLEDVTGEKVYGFRAPEFSITDKTLWALDILLEAGFCYDSSIYPTSFHDVYGIAGAKTSIHKLPNGLVEFPLSVIDLFGMRIPFAGGGYFRLYPLFLTKLFIHMVNRESPCMIYLHPYEVGPMIPKISGLSAYRKFRHYYNCANGAERLNKIINAFEFIPVMEILKRRNLLECPSTIKCSR